MVAVTYDVGLLCVVVMTLTAAENEHQQQQQKSSKRSRALFLDSNQVQLPASLLPPARRESLETTCVPVKVAIDQQHSIWLYTSTSTALIELSLRSSLAAVLQCSPRLRLSGLSKFCRMHLQSRHTRLLAQ